MMLSGSTRRRLLRSQNVPANCSGSGPCGSGSCTQRLDKCATAFEQLLVDPGIGKDPALDACDIGGLADLAFAQPPQYLRGVFARHYGDTCGVGLDDVAGID